MPNSFGPLGLTTATQTELLDQFTTSYEEIYGADINIASDTSDGQTINNFIQSVLDVEDLVTQTNASFDPDQAVGTILDQRCAINGVIRKAGTFTITNITMITSASVTLYGLDQEVQPVYTISDNAGNLWELVTTQLGLSTGTNVLVFQAALAGAIFTVPNTITVQVTIVLGITSVNNPTTYTTLGTNEESDPNLKLRRQQSVSNSSQGYLPGLLGTLRSLTGVTFANVFENDTSTTDEDGIPGHSIWVIVAGTAQPVDIATAIYQKRNAGCGMFGEISYTLVQINGTTFTVFWDTVATQNLFISFTATSIDGVNQPNIAAILAQLPTLFVPGVFQEININTLATTVQNIDPNTLVTASGFSIAQTQIFTLSGTAASGTFVVNYNGNASSAINWNDSIGTIQTKIQGITGLAAATVTGSISSHVLTFNLTAIVDVLGLLYVTANGLMTSGSVAITVSYNEGYTNTLTPADKNFQFVVSSDDIIILPIILSPSTITLPPLGTQTFTALGGYAPYTYALVTNNSGGSIDGTTGAYTVGSTGSVSDTIGVTDAFGHTGTATVTVN